MPQRLTDDDLLKLTHILIQESDSYLDEKIRPERAQAMRYYQGENPDRLPLVDGRSQMVDTQVRDTIEWIMPDLIRTFAGDDEVVAIEPHGEEDTFDADLAEQWVNYVIMRHNRGFLTTHHWIKDALMLKQGFLKQYWKPIEIRKRRDFEGLTQDEFEYLKRAEDYEVTDHAFVDRVNVALPDGSIVKALEEEIVPGMEPVLDEEGDPIIERLVDVTGYEVSEESKLVEEPVPPEEILFLQDTKEIPWKCRFIAHECETTIGELREMFPEATIPDDIAGGPITGTGIFDEEEIERHYDSSATDLSDDLGIIGSIDPSSRKVYHYECYAYVDRDGDGVPEWVQVHRVGKAVLAIDEVDYPKIFAICPVLWPHRAVGLSLADLTSDLQDLQTALNRQILDHIYQTNNPRSEIDMNTITEHTLDDYLDNRIGGFVRTNRPGTVTPLQTSPLEPWTFNLLEHWEQKRESRTGVSRLNGGMDPDSLNKTATGVVQILNQAARRVEMIARIFAETGFRDRVKGILDLSMEYPDYVKGQILRLTGDSIEMDPEKISGRYDLVVNAGIGSGNRDQHAMHMQQLLQVHQQLAMAGLGPGAGEKQMVTLKNIYNVVRDMISNWGHRNTADYITDPADENAERDPVQEPQPSKEQLDHQVDMQKLQIEQQKAQADAQAKQQEILLEREKLALEREKLALERRKVEAEEWRIGHEAGMKQGDKDKKDEIQSRERIETRKLDLEERKLANEEAEMRREEETTDALQEQVTKTGDLIAQIKELAMSVNKPKRIKRNKDGLIEEIA